MLLPKLDVGGSKPLPNIPNSFLDNEPMTASIDNVA